MPNCPPPLPLVFLGLRCSHYIVTSQMILQSAHADQLTAFYRIEKLTLRFYLLHHCSDALLPLSK